MSPAPVTGRTTEILRRGPLHSYDDRAHQAMVERYPSLHWGMADWLDEVERSQPGVNYAQLVGHSEIRRAVMGHEARAAVVARGRKRCRACAEEPGRGRLKGYRPAWFTSRRAGRRRASWCRWRASPPTMTVCTPRTSAARGRRISRPRASSSRSPSLRVCVRTCRTCRANILCSGTPWPRSRCWRQPRRAASISPSTVRRSPIVQPHRLVSCRSTISPPRSWWRACAIRRGELTCSAPCARPTPGIHRGALAPAACPTAGPGTA